MLIKNHARGKVYRYPHIVVNMTDSDTIARVAEMFGNSVHQVENGKSRNGNPTKKLYRACITGMPAVSFMKAILPHMSLRRTAKINSILSHHNCKPDPNECRKSWSKEMVKTRLRDIRGKLIKEKYDAS